ncbi:HAMP domain-containing protein [Candidatus Azambacteria bacterium]|nr:HAMP domain-containing protein [Candidatus Azambacteria bacterium]
MKLSLTQQALLLCAITLLSSGIALIWFGTDARVLVLAITISIAMAAFGVRILFSTIRSLSDLRSRVDQVAKGNYDVITPVRGIGEIEKLVDAFNVMAFRLKHHERHLAHKAYQAAVLKEISERITASLDESEAVEIIAGSLGKVVPYSIASYLTLKNNGAALLKCHIEESVNKAFAEEAKRILFGALAALGNSTLSEEQIEKTICFGAFFDEEAKAPVRSHFTLPIYVNSALTGIITVTSATPNLYKEEEIGILYTVTEQAGATISKTKALIAEESNKTQSMLSSINEGLIMVTTGQKISIINEKAKEIIGIPHQDNPTLLDVIQALYGTFDFRGATDRVLASKQTQSFQEFTAGASAYKIIANPVKEKDGDIVGVVFIFSDITKEKEIDRMKTEFISITSHQLRTPLSSMKWFLEMLINKDAGELPEKAKTIVEDVYRSNERIITLVNDLLDVSRIEAGKMQNEPTPTNLIEFLKSMLPEAEQQFKQRCQTFEFRRPDTLPRAMVDPKLVWQVIGNLLSNASKYTPEGGKISLELSIHDDAVLCAITDNGYGIPEFQQHRIFEKFFRADNTAKMEGTGLGMHIARQITNAMGGTLWFESAEGKGTAFYLSLPITGAKKQEKPVRSRAKNDTLQPI